MGKEMKVLLSIKPIYADKIFAGTKKYEFRRSLSYIFRVKMSELK